MSRSEDGDSVISTGSKYLEYGIQNIEQSSNNNQTINHNAIIQWNAQKIIHIKLPRRTLKGDFTGSQGGLFWSSPLRSDGSLNN